MEKPTTHEEIAFALHRPILRHKALADVRYVQKLYELHTRPPMPHARPEGNPSDFEVWCSERAEKAKKLYGRVVTKLGILAINRRQDIQPAFNPATYFDLDN